jgi:uncharacterized delta-60 repeat protein
MLRRYWPKKRFAAFVGAGATIAAAGVAFAHPDAVAVGSSRASGREGRSSSIDWGLALAVGRDGKPVVAGRSASQGRPRMALARYTTRGKLDRSFGVGGKTLTSFGSKSETRAVSVALQADGKVVLAGGVGSSFALARYTARGRLDPSFGQNGKVVTHFGSRRNFSQATAIAVQPNGKIVAVGSWFRNPINGPVRFALARYTPRGRLDPSFGQGGKVLTSFRPKSDAQAAALLIQPDGKLVVAGEDTPRTPSGSIAVALARYHADGTLDRSFGRGGRVVSSLGDYVGGASAAVLQKDGKIVVDANDQVRSYLARYTVDGKLDSSFGRGGKAVASRRVLPLLALQRGGKLILAGSVIARHGRAFFLRRYTQKGDVDSSFGRDGKVFTDFGSPAVANALAVQANGKIVVAGDRTFNDFAVARYTSSGRLDGSFGTGGKVTTDFGSVWRPAGT